MEGTEDNDASQNWLQEDSRTLEVKEHLLRTQVDRRAKQVKYNAYRDTFMSSSSSGRCSEDDGPDQTYLMPWDEPAAKTETSIWEQEDLPRVLDGIRSLGVSSSSGSIDPPQERGRELKAYVEPAKPSIVSVRVKADEGDWTYPLVDKDELEQRQKQCQEKTSMLFKNQLLAEYLGLDYSDAGPIPGVDYSKVGSVEWSLTAVKTCFICKEELVGTYYHCLDCPVAVRVCESCEKKQVFVFASGHTIDHVVAKLRPGQVLKK